MLYSSQYCFVLYLSKWLGTSIFLIFLLSFADKIILSFITCSSDQHKTDCKYELQRVMEIQPAILYLLMEQKIRM